MFELFEFNLVVLLLGLINRVIISVLTICVNCYSDS
jgi:hypothetical protein